MEKKLECDLIRYARIGLHFTSLAHDALRIPHLAARSRTSLGRNLQCAQCWWRPLGSRLSSTLCFLYVVAAGYLSRGARPAKCYWTPPVTEDEIPWRCFTDAHVSGWRNHGALDFLLPSSLEQGEHFEGDKSKFTSQWRGKKGAWDRQTHSRKSSVSYGAGSAA